MRSRRPPSARKAFSSCAEMLVEQVVGLVDQADKDVRGHFGWARFQIGPIGLIGHILVAPSCLTKSASGCSYPRGEASAFAENPDNLLRAPPGSPARRLLALSRLP